MTSFRLTRYDRSIGLGLEGYSDHAITQFMNVQEMVAYFGALCTMFNLIAPMTPGDLGALGAYRHFTVWLDL
jgi:hypothetical protein